VDAYVGRAEAYLARSEFKDALADADSAPQVNSQSPWGWLRRGEALMGLNRWAEARQEFEMVLQLDPNGTAGILAQSHINVIDR